MWKLSDADATIYLFGGIHKLPPGLNWQSGMVDTAIASADTLVMELSPREQAEAPAVFAALGSSTPQAPILRRIPSQYADEYETLSRHVPAKRDQLDTLESWAAALLLSHAVGQSANLSVELGTEKQLEARFQNSGKAVEGLETAYYQLGLLDTLPQRSQDELLTRTIADSGISGARFNQLVAAWAKGDIAAIERYTAEELRTVDGLAGPLLETRNRNWARWIERRLATPGTVLIAVGAGHLVGPDSVQVMLAAEGIHVERVQ